MEDLETRVVGAMKTLGFNATDARAYLALLKQHPATGYELATRSGVPRSAVYNVLKRLQALGLINAVQEKPARYVPLPPERLYALLETRFSRSLDALKEELVALEKPPAGGVTWTVEGYDAMLEQAEHLISEAKTRVVASLWGREAERLSKALEAAVARGVQVVLFSFTPLPAIGRTVSYGLDETELAEHWEHRIILLRDRDQLLVGRAEHNEDNRAVVTDEVSLIEMAVSNLVLDLTLYGERQDEDVAELVTSLTDWLAPVEKLLRAKTPA